MQNNSEIESFFSELNLTLGNLIEILPAGVIVFDKKWKVKTINSSFKNLIQSEWGNANLEGVNLFSKNILSEKLPLKSILELKKNKQFEEEIIFIGKSGREIKLVAKGSPIIRDDIFQGGIIIIDDFSSFQNSNSADFTSSNILINILSKICKCFLIIDTKGAIQFASEVKESRCLLFSNSQSQNITEVFHTESETSIKSILKNVVNTKSQEFVQIYYFAENEKINFNSVFLPIKIQKDDVSFVLVLLRESNTRDEDTISYLSNSRKLSEFESFANADSDGLFKINLHGNITYWTDNATKLFSISEKNIYAKFIDELFPEISQQYFEVIRKNLLSEGIWTGYFSRKADEQKFIIKVKIVAKQQYQTTDFFVYCNLINEKQQKVILAKEEEKLFFKDAVVKSNQMILQANPAGTILFVNEIFCEKFGYELDEIRGLHILDMIPSEFIDNNKITEFEFLINNRDFEVIPLKTKTSELFEVTTNVNISTTNTDLKYFTIYLREFNRQEKIFLETAHSLLYKFSEAILIVNENSIVKVNPKFCKLFGTDFESDYFEKNIKEIIDPNSADLIDLILNSGPNYKIDSTIEFIKKDTTKFEANLIKICCTKETSYSVLAIIPIEQAQEKNIEKDEIIQSELECSGPFFWSGEYENGRLTINYVSEKFLKHVGFKENYFNYNQNFWFDFLHPNDTEKFNSFIENLTNEKEEDVAELKFRIIDKKGDTVWINTKVKSKKIDNSDSYIINGSITDITDVSLEEEKLKDRITELEKLNNAKEKFISIISHDLKSPFTSIVGFSELILTDSELDKEEIIQYVGHIKDASMHTVDLLNGLLDLTKLQTGRIEIEPKVINANYVTNKTVEILSGLAMQKGISLKADVDKSLYINADENLIFQVFNNLVANSIKFTPNGGSIKINAREIPGQQKIEFIVEDTGIGIEKEDLDKLFVLDKKFTTLGTDGEKGTGLGLSLVNEIIVKHNGSISVESEINKGSRFIFTLPISTPSILIIDGIDAERVLYARLLKSITKSVEILQASNAEEGLKIAKEKMPMLIIFEHNLPNIKGSEFVEMLKKSDLPYNPSLMILTKEFSEELKAMYRNLDVDFVFSKPFNLQEFKDQLDKLVGKSE